MVPRLLQPVLPDKVFLTLHGCQYCETFLSTRYIVAYRQEYTFHKFVSTSIIIYITSHRCVQSWMIPGLCTSHPDTMTEGADCVHSWIIPGWTPVTLDTMTEGADCVHSWIIPGWTPVTLDTMTEGADCVHS